MRYVLTDYLKALGYVFSRPRILLRLVAPALLSILAFPFFFWGLFSWHQPVVAALTPSFWPELFGGILWLLYCLLAIVLASVLSAACIFLLFGFFLESALEILLRDQGFRIPETSGAGELLRSIVHSIRDEIPRTALFITLSLIAFAASLVPPCVLVAPVLIAISLGMNAFDLPLALVGRRFNQRLAMVRSRAGATLAVGAFAALLAFIPFFGVFFVGLSHFAAAFQIARWHELDAERRGAAAG